MANNYLQFSAALDDLTQEEAAWVATLASLGNSRDDLEHFDEDGTGKSELGKLAEKLWGDADTYISCDQEETNGVWSIWFYSEEGNDPYAVGQVVQEFIKKFRPGSGFKWGMQWAETCSRLRLDEFGGGAIAVTEDKIVCMSTSYLLEQMLKNPERFEFDE